MNYQIIKISEQPNWILKAALWFSKKWKIKKEEYQKSMLDSVNSPIPEWYILLDSNQTILAGAGVIENDFHPYHEFCPNLCALYVQKKIPKSKISNTFNSIHYKRYATKRNQTTFSFNQSYFFL